MLLLDQTSDHSAHETFVGDEIQLRLAENPDGGYRWALQVSDAAALRLVSDSFETAGAGLGGGGVRVWTFTVDRAALVSLKAEFKRSWEPNSDRTFEAAISAKPR